MKAKPNGEASSQSGSAKKADEVAGGAIADSVIDSSQTQAGSKVAIPMDSASAQLKAFLQSGAAAGNTKASDAALAKQLSTGEKAAGKGLTLSLQGVDAGDAKTAKDGAGKVGEIGSTDKTGKSDQSGRKEDKTGKTDKAEKEDQTGAAQMSVAMPPQIAVQVAAPAAVSTPSSPVSQGASKGESKSSRGAKAPAATHSASGRADSKSAQGVGGAKGGELPVPGLSSEPQNIESGIEGLPAGAHSPEIADGKSTEKQDTGATTPGPNSEVLSSVKHPGSSLAVTDHSQQNGSGAAGGPSASGEAVSHLAAPPQNSTGVPGPISVASSGPVASAVSPYDRIDQGTAPVLLHSGLQQVAVGVHDPSLGWVEINTQNTAGHVNATLIAASGQTHDSLAAQLPAISQFLEQRDVRVGTLSVQQHSAGSGTNQHFGNGSGSGTSAHHSGPGNNGNTGSNGNNSGGRHAPQPQYAGPLPVQHSGATVANGTDRAATYRPLSYISVRA